MVRPYRRRIVLCLVVLLGALGTTLAGPALVEYAINDGLVNRRSMTVVDVAAGLYLASAIASYYLTRAQTFLLSSTGEYVLNDLRKRVFAHLLDHSLAFFDDTRSGQLLARMTADIDVLETLVQNGLGTAAMSVGLFIVSAVALIITSPILFGVTAVCLAPALVATARYRTASTRAYGAVRTRIGDTVSTLDESLAGVRVIQAFRQERRVTEEFDRRNERQLEAELNTVRLMSRFFPKIEGTGVVATVAALVVGGVLVDAHRTSVGAVAAFVLYIANLFSSIYSLSQLFDLLQSSGAALTTVVDLLETTPQMPEAIDPVPLPRRGRLEVRDVTFAYGAVHGSLAVSTGLHTGPALRSIDLDVAPGEHVVLVGATGSGKSTLAKLIGRLYDPSSGSVCFGGVDLRSVARDELRSRIVVVPQECFLFRGSVLDNILIARPGAGRAAALAAVERLGITEQLARLPRGLDTDVGERGALLSAGERQLVSLARAVLADPSLLVMDEATSSIDPGTELVVDHALVALTEGRTTVTVAHRLTTAARADRVAVIDKGRLIEVGSHDQLIEEGGAYARLYAAWIGGVES